MRKPLLWTLAVTFFLVVPAAAVSQADAQAKPAAQSPIVLKPSPAAEAALRDSGCCEAMRRQLDLANQVIKTYYLKNLSQPGEIQDIVNGLRTILEFQRVQPSPRLPAIVVRGTPEQVAAADKLIADLDRPKPVASALNDRGGDNYRLDFTLTELDGGKKTATHTYTVVVQRGRNFEESKKTSFRVGSKVPIATGSSLQPGAGGVGVNPIVNRQITYNDVGVNMECRLYGPEDELALNGNVELSNIAGSVDIGGLAQPVVRQAKSEFAVAIVPGKSVIIAGLDSVEAQRRVDVEVVATKLK